MKEILRLPTLYKRNNRNQLQKWDIQVLSLNENEEAAILKIDYGVNKVISTQKKITTGKNLGKKNATTPIMQAIAEAHSLWNQKKASGYVENEEAAIRGEIDSEVVAGGIDPMLAETYAVLSVNSNNEITEDLKKSNGIQFPAYIQPKLDGIRCIAIISNHKCTLWTRNRKPITSVPHIILALESLGYQDVIFDGELYSNDYQNNFEEIVSIVRKTKTISKNSTKLDYYIYDCVNADPQDKRFLFLEQVKKIVAEKGVGCVKFCPTEIVSSHEEVIKRAKEFMQNGYEGAMLRNMEASYNHCRSTNLQKIKMFQEDEFLIADVMSGQGKYQDCAIFVCSTAKSLADIDWSKNVFEVKMKGSINTLRSIYEKKEFYIGKELTVQFQGFTSNKIPRFPVGKCVRDYE